MEDLDEESRFALEKELDEQHKPLTEFEKARRWVEKAEEVAPKLEERRAELSAKVGGDTNASAPGRRPEPTPSKKEIAQALGVPETTLRRAESHVRAVEQLGVSASLPQATALKIAALPDDHHAYAGLKYLPTWYKCSTLEAVTGRRVLCPSRPRPRSLCSPNCPLCQVYPSSTRPPFLH